MFKLIEVHETTTICKDYFLHHGYFNYKYSNITHGGGLHSQNAKTSEPLPLVRDTVLTNNLEDEKQDIEEGTNWKNTSNNIYILLFRIEFC